MVMGYPYFMKPPYSQQQSPFLWDNPTQVVGICWVSCDIVDITKKNCGGGAQDDRRVFGGLTTSISKTLSVAFKVNIVPLRLIWVCLRIGNTHTNGWCQENYDNPDVIFLMGGFPNIFRFHMSQSHRSAIEMNIPKFVFPTLTTKKGQSITILISWVVEIQPW